MIYGNVFRNCTGDDAAIGATYGLFGDVNTSSNEFYDWDATDTTGPKNVIRIGFGDCYETVIYNNTIHDLSVGQNNFWSGYIAISCKSTQTKIISNTFYNLGNPSSRASPVIVTKGRQSTIIGNSFRDSWAKGIDLIENDTMISGNRFTNLSGTYHDLWCDHSVPAIYAHNFKPDIWYFTKNLTVTSNDFTYNDGSSIWCNGTHTYDVTIESNIIGNSGSVTESAIILSGGLHNATFTLNTFMSDVLFSAPQGFGLNASDYGNYWASSPDTTDANHDGIDDVPYNVPSTWPNQWIDYLPLVVPPKKCKAYPVIQTPSNNDHVHGDVSTSINSSMTIGVLYEGTPTTTTTVDLNGTNVYSGGLGPAEFTFDSTSFADGFYVLTLRILVDGTDEFVTSINLWIDNTAPVINDNLVDGHVFTSQPISIDVSCLDESSTVAWIVILLNGTLQTNHTGSPVLYSLAFSDEGLYIINITTSDAVGNIATVLKSVYYDHTAPELVGPSGPITYEEGTTGNTVTISATDMTPSGYNVSFDSEVSAQYPWNGDDIVINIDGLTAGTHYMYVVVYDRGAQSSYLTIEILVTEPTTSTTTTPTPITTTTAPTSGLVPPVIDPILLIAILGGAGGVVVVIIVILMKKRQSK